MTGTTWSAAYLASSLFINVFSSCSFSFRLSPSVGRIMHDKKGFYDRPCIAYFLFLLFCCLLTFLWGFFVAFLLRSLSIATVHLHVSASIFIIKCTKTKDPASKILIFQSGQYKLLIKSFYMIFFHAHVVFFSLETCCSFTNA